MSRKKLLLHTCCAPCSVYVGQKLNSEYDVVFFYYNPNIDSPGEYKKRAAEMKKLSEKTGIPLLMGDYEVDLWKNRTADFKDEPEGGKRCRECFLLRLEKTAQVTREKNFDLFATTLTVAPMKNADLINRVGAEAAASAGVEYMKSNFKKKDGYKKSVSLSRKYGFYRQNYCGCSYSKIEAAYRRKGKN